jgi:hypothetical protein
MHTGGKERPQCRSVGRQPRTASQRRAIHENLIRAQTRLIETSGGEIKLLQLDLDKDGCEEILMWNPVLSLGLDPISGGGLFEIRHLPCAVNLSDTLTRRREAYHHRLHEMTQSDSRNADSIQSIHDLARSTDETLERSLIYDDYSIISLLDHFLSQDATVETYAANEYDELGDFIKGEYLTEKVFSFAKRGRCGIRTYRSCGCQKPDGKKVYSNWGGSKDDHRL